MPSEESDRSILQNQAKPSRRRVITEGIGLVGLSLTPIIPYLAQDLTQSSSEELTDDEAKRQALIKELQEAGVELYVTEDLKAQLSELWDLPRLELTKKVLGLFPPIQLSNESDEPLKLVLDLPKDRLNGTFDRKINAVFLNHTIFKAKSDKEAALWLAHALVLNFQPITEGQLDKQLGQPFNELRLELRKKMVDKLPFLKGVEELIGQKSTVPLTESFIATPLNDQDGILFRLATGNFKTEGPKKAVSDLGISKNDEEYSVFGLHLVEALNRGQRREFVATLAESYIQGRDYWNKWVKPILGDEASINMYRLLQHSVFRGREYDSLDKFV